MTIGSEHIVKDINQTKQTKTGQKLQVPLLKALFRSAYRRRRNLCRHNAWSRYSVAHWADENKILTNAHASYDDGSPICNDNRTVIKPEIKSLELQQTTKYPSFTSVEGLMKKQTRTIPLKNIVVIPVAKSTCRLTLKSSPNFRKFVKFVS